MNVDHTLTALGMNDEWAVRQRYWSKKLGRIRLGVEPVQVQLDKYRRVTIGMTVFPFSVGLMFVALFSAFGRPDVGLILASVLFIPVVAIAWIDFAVLSSRVKRYLREVESFESTRRVRL